MASGALLSLLAARVAGFQAAISPVVLAIGFVTSVAVGIAAGLYPAIRASWMEPMDAIRA